MSEALGMIECRSFPAMVEAADAMVKAAKVELSQLRENGRRLYNCSSAGRRCSRKGSL